MKNNRLSIEIWKYLMFFSIAILLFLWIFQILFLNKFYEIEKRKDIKEVAENVLNSTNSNDIEKTITNSSYDKNVCVEITNDYETLYSSTYLSFGCLVGNKEKSSYKNDFINSNKTSSTYKILNPKFNNKTLVYAVKLDNELYAFFNTSLEPIDSTVTILKKQFIYVTLIVLILAFLIAYFISQHISNPIIKINNSAKRLAEGNFNTVFDSNSNISEINELESTLNYARDELYKTEELRRDLMANVSHDLKTPLTMIKAYAEMARDLNNDNKKKRENNLNVIIEETDRLTVLVNDILTLSSMQEELDKLNYSTFDLVELINNILKRYEIYKELENYNFMFIHSGKCEISADKKKIEQVIYNLINNAINYTGDDKKVVINIRKNKDTTRVEIIDTGAGINKKDIPYIWDKYYKSQKKHKRNLVGTGLGLAIVKSILESHNYNYGVISKKDIGTTFYFEIKKINRKD